MNEFEIIRVAIAICMVSVAAWIVTIVLIIGKRRAGTKKVPDGAKYDSVKSKIEF